MPVFLAQRLETQEIIRLPKKACLFTILASFLDWTLVSGTPKTAKKEAEY